MSHITTVQLEIKDLDALQAACEELGLELVRGQTQYKWFGRFVGDYNDPAVKELGVPISEYGKCEHAIRVQGAGSQTYEIGVVRNPKGEGYVLLLDFWSGGYGLMEKVSSTGKSSGKDCDRLKQAYTAHVSMRELTRAGYRVQRVNEGGSIRIKATRPAKAVARR